MLDDKLKALWTRISPQTEDGFAINRYFIDHPKWCWGRQEPVSTAIWYGLHREPYRGTGSFPTSCMMR